MKRITDLMKTRVKISMICFSLTGEQTGEKLKEGLEKLGYEATLSQKSKYLPDSIKESTTQWAKEQFDTADGIIFLGATGIAVRSIAPYVQSKKADPAVLVIDECGNFVISLLSGHLGGANELARTAAEILHAVPVVTTATDLHQKFAVDVFAKKNHCHIFRMKEAKEVSAALLAGEPVGFYSEFPWEGELPEGLIWWSGENEEENREKTDRNGNQKKSDQAEMDDWNAKAGLSGKPSLKPEIGIAVTIHKNCLPFARTTHVVPPVVFLGMGCKKGKEWSAVETLAQAILEQNQIYPEAVAALASIDVKKEEPGLLALAERLDIPFQTFSSEELLAVEGEFTPSSFVRQTVGVDNVCERSAMKAAQESAKEDKNIRKINDNLSETQNEQKKIEDISNEIQIIQKKTADKGVTAALVQGKWRMYFDERTEDLCGRNRSGIL